MKYFLFIFLYILNISSLSSQVFWSEDFSNGIPSEWEIEEVSNYGITWTYCPDTTSYSTGPDNTCPHNFDECENGNGNQKHFQSDTPTNGYATCVIEPFITSLGNSPFLVNLTTDAIDCSDQDNVFIEFNSHIGINWAEGGSDIMLRVSTDKTNWSTYYPHSQLRPFPSTLPGFKRWSKNAEKIAFDISEIAGKEKEVFIQWRWTGRDEYHWSIDDVKLSSETTIPAVDISLSPTGPFHALMPNYKTPMTQTETVYFLTDVGNLGSQLQSNIDIIAQVIDKSNNVLYSDTVNILQLDINEIIEVNSFRPYIHQAGQGEFKITYEATSPIEDARADDNFFSYPFFITESKFEKNETTTKTIELFPRNAQNLPERNWSIANHFYIPNGENYFLDSVQFEIPDRIDIFSNGNEFIFNDFDVSLPLRLYEWTNSDDLNLATNNEYVLVGQGEFQITEDHGNEVLSVNLEVPNNVNNDINIPLKNDQHYILAIDYSAPSFNKYFFIKASTQLDYDATIRANELAGRQRFASLNKIGNLNNTYSTFSFGGDVIPHIGFTITSESGVSTMRLVVEDGLHISPNPVDKIAQIKFNLGIQENDKLELMDINGRLIKTIPLAQGQNQYDLDCSMLPNANYLLTYKSEKVISTTKLIVLH
jgi:hypothetical protein